MNFSIFYYYNILKPNLKFETSALSTPQVPPLTLITGRYKPYVPKEGEDPMAEYMNLLAMLFSMCGLMMRFKWAAWAAVSYPSP